MYAKIEGETIIEVFECSHIRLDAVECGSEVTVGWQYINGEFIKPFSLSVSEKIKELKGWHDAQTEAMKAKYSKSEVESFLDKRNEAMAWRVDNTAPTPYVDSMSGGNETERVALLNAILAKVDAAAQLEAYVLSKRDAIEACTTQAELEAITW